MKFPSIELVNPHVNGNKTISHTNNNKISALILFMWSIIKYECSDLWNVRIKQLSVWNVSKGSNKLLHPKPSKVPYLWYSVLKCIVPNLTLHSTESLQ